MSTSSRAALTSSSRRTGVSCGALLTSAGSLRASSAIALHRRDEGVERRLALGLGRLDHQRLRHDQRKIVGRRMKAVVEQPLADVERAHAGAVDRAAADEFVHVDAVERHREGVAQLDAQIIGVEHRVLGICAQAGGAVLPDVGVGAHEHAEIAEERRHPADRLRRHRQDVARSSSPSRSTAISGPGRKSSSRADTPTGPEPGPAAAVRGREGLVQIVVHHVEAEIARPRDAGERIQVGAVAVDEAAAVVHEPHHLSDVLLEQAERVRDWSS